MEGTSGIPLSVLDLAPVKEGGTVSESFRETLDLARHAEALGYRRFWLAEHHNMAGIASAATAVLIGYVAGGTKTIRVGSGGVMLPNHAPLVIAEQFGTLESLYPGRIDFGIGRAPGTDQLTMRALRRTLTNVDEDFPRDVAELLSYFAPAPPRSSGARRARRGAAGARLAAGFESLQRATRGPDGTAVRLRLPLCARTPDAGARNLQGRVPSVRGARRSPTRCRASTCSPRTRTRRPAACSRRSSRRSSTCDAASPACCRHQSTAEATWSEVERAGVGHALRYSAVGSPETVRRWLESFIQETQADEIMVTAQIFDHAARLRSSKS